jgi:4-hydroxybenzoate polyprenyltransferase
VTVILAVVAGVVLTQLATWQAKRRPMVGVLWFGANAVLCTAVSAWALTASQWLGGAWMAFCAAVNAWMAWEHWNRRKRKRAAALAGAKSRARVAALVRKAREAARPRKVLRPVPGGAR